MNERLKQHFQQYLDENEGIFYPEQTAQHFYNLALDSVRKMVQEDYDACDKFHDNDEDYYDGRMYQCQIVLKKIDNLTK